MFNVGGGEILVILLLGLIVLGPDKLPETARAIGKHVSTVRRIRDGFQQELAGALDTVTRPPSTPSTPPTPPTPPTAPVPTAEPRPTEDPTGPREGETRPDAPQESFG